MTAGSPWIVEGNDAAKLHALTERIVDYKPAGGTNMYACLSQVATALKGTQLKGLIIVMSDGKSDTGGRQAAVKAINDLGIPIVAIAFGKDADPDQLKEVANATGGAFFQQNDLVAALRQAAGYK